MKPVDLASLAQDPEPRAVVYGASQPQYVPLPALLFADGKILTEWELTEEERTALIRGERLRLWMWPCGHPLQPIMLEVTSERKP